MSQSEIDREIEKIVENGKRIVAEEIERREREIAMFGTTIENLEIGRPEYIDPLMYAMSILSDAQEAISYGQNEIGRQYINRAKYFIGEVRNPRNQ